jgi:glutamate racemase
MDDRPIGVFDSGLGGLTAVKRLTQLLPNEDIVYLGDTGRTPYGPRSRETIMKYAREDTAFLLTRDVKAVVIACNTVSSAALSAVRALTDLPVFDVVKAPSLKAAAATRNGIIGVICTAATIRSGAYARELARIDPALRVISAACPLFVPLAENGRTDANDVVARTLAEEYLAPILNGGADTLILGCTHYPLLRGVIAAVLGGGVSLIDSGAAEAEDVARGLRERALLSARTSPGRRRYCVTDSPEDFTALASRFLDADLSGAVEQVTLGV